MSRSWVVIDHDAIAHNVAVLRGTAGPATAVCAVVKADGYGHGMVEVARTALRAGASWLGVAHADEGGQLRCAGIDAPVLLLSEPVLPDELDAVVAAGLRVTVYHEDAVDALAATGAPIAVHLKVDTGLRRVGARPADVVALARRIRSAPGLTLEGVWTHFALADSPSDPFTALQVSRFAEVVDELERAGFDVPVRHAANSAGAIAHPDARFGMVRPGIALYGVEPSAELAGAVGLRPALSWHTRVSFVKTVPAGEGISYGHRHRTTADTVVATVPVGYADGLPRAWGLAGGPVLIGGVRRPLIGAVTMDQALVDCGPGAEVRVGDEVVLIGRQGDAVVTADEIAAGTGTISYEILTGIGPRVERRHVGGGAEPDGQVS